jgi:hypothetical protein
MVISGLKEAQPGVTTIASGAFMVLYGMSSTFMHKSAPHLGSLSTDSVVKPISRATLDVMPLPLQRSHRWGALASFAPLVALGGPRRCGAAPRPLVEVDGPSPPLLSSGSAVGEEGALSSFSFMFGGHFVALDSPVS